MIGSRTTLLSVTHSVLDIDECAVDNDVVMDARIFKDAASAPALSDLSWIERKRIEKVFTFFPP